MHLRNKYITDGLFSSGPAFARSLRELITSARPLQVKLVYTRERLHRSSVSGSVPFCIWARPKFKGPCQL